MKLGDLIGLKTPQAIVIVLAGAILLLSIVPTTELKYSPFKSVNKHLLPLFFENCPEEGIFKGCCPSCGLTRATSRLLHGDVKGAWDYNPLVFPALAAILGVLVANIRKIPKPTR